MSLSALSECTTTLPASSPAPPGSVTTDSADVSKLQPTSAHLASSSKVQPAFLSAPLDTSQTCRPKLAMLALLAAVFANLALPALCAHKDSLSMLQAIAR